MGKAGLMGCVGSNDPKLNRNLQNCLNFNQMSKGMNERRKFDSRDGSYLQTVCVKDRHSSESLKVCVGWESLKLVVRAYKMQAGLINFG